MKKLQIVVTTICLTLLTSSFIYGGEVSKKTGKSSREMIVSNLLEGLKSSNCGLKMSCAYFLGELKSERAVIPLMKMLRDEENECSRLMAALALIKIEDARGVFMVKRQAEFDDCLRVRNICKILYKAVQHKQLREKESEQVVAYTGF